MVLSGKTYLSNRGYAIEKKDNEVLINELQKSLTVTPRGMQLSNDEAASFPVYKENDKKMYLPKYYGLTKFGVPNVDQLSDGEDRPNLIFEGSLRDIQKPAVNAFLDAVNDPTKQGGLLSLPCGFGKTICALYISTVFKKKTLIICHTNFLIDQWIERIQQYIPTANIGKIKQKLCEIEGKDIVIASLQSLAMRDYDNKLFKTFGLVTLDECFPYSQPILTNKGFIPIGQLYDTWISDDNMPLILSYNENTHNFEWKELMYAWKNIYKESLIKITFKDLNDNMLHSIECTPDHLLLVATNEWKEAKKLNIGDRMTSCIKDMIVETIEYVNSNDLIDSNHVYDIEVKDNHNFICNYIIAHNCHHLGAEVFSRCLPIVTCKRMLGLSATLKRKDGLSKVFEWYLGKPVYTVKRKDSDVIIHVERYYDPKPDYCTEQTLWRGPKLGKQLNIAKMINQVCDYLPRNKRMVTVLKEILIKEPNRKVLVLSERRNHLQELENLLRLEGYKSIGYYVGGMNKEQLDKGTLEDIILATFQLASEAMDIPKLNTLLLGSPVSSVEQPVGRIQRKKKEERDYIPLVIDFIDEFSLFERQGAKRLAFYKKNGYDIQDVTQEIKQNITKECKYKFIIDEDDN